KPGGGGTAARFSLVTYSLISLRQAGSNLVVVVVVVSVVEPLWAKAAPANPTSTAAISSFFIAFPLTLSGNIARTGNTLRAAEVPRAPGRCHWLRARQHKFKAAAAPQSAQHLLQEILALVARHAPAAKNFDFAAGWAD